MCAAAVMVSAFSAPAWASTTGMSTLSAASDLSGLSIEDLANIDISSVSKADQPLSEAPAAVYVITHDEIIRSGATRLAEMLRLAPNLQVAEVTGSSYAISARGFNGTAAAKLLVLIDGRSIYTPFFSGVFWGVHDVPPETIERIEVISGPGATLWGANAVNGVINIVTRNTADTQGAVLEVAGGGRERRASLQYGGKLREDLSYRVYAETAGHGHNVTAAGVNAHDGWRQGQGGFRLDWTPGADLVTLQGDIYDGSESYAGSPGQAAKAEESVSGYNLLARWTTHLGGGSTLQVQAYYDYLERVAPGIAGDYLRTYDLDVQHSFSLGAAHEIVWGGGYRRTADRFPIVPGNPSSPFTQFFSPESRTLGLGNLFAQDTIALSPSLKLTVGLKFEDDPYSGIEPLPSTRLSWKVTDTTLLWAAVSRAVRAPSRLDRDFHQVLGSFVVIAPGTFQPETLVAYELGYRGRPSSRTSLSISAFYNIYDDLRSFERPPAGGFPITIGNRMEGETYGVEAWGAYQVRDWWRLMAGANWLHEDLRFKAGSSGVGGIESAGDDPDYQLSLRSTMTLPRGVDLDLQLRRVGALPAPASPAYTELNGRLGWALTKKVELSVSGFNLLNDHHPEFGAATAAVQLGPTGVEIGRSVVAGARLRF
ncbi:MAG: TonB-dependent receptor, plug [Phenylobacterium sp.]|nr:TonB-dependent receptor, plug [Phenylobacterium sp.]